MIDILSFAEKLKKEKSIALFCHIHPDGDTIGSACAIKLALIKAGIKADVYSSDEIPSRFCFLNEIKNIKNRITEEYSAYLAVDNADVTRLGDFCEVFTTQKNTFNIDHHVSNLKYAKVNYVMDRAANAENALDLINALGVEIDSEIANLLALGIVTDTGGFRHKNVTPSTLLYCSKLVEKGADLNKIFYYMFNLQSRERAKLYGMTMEKIRYFMDGKIAIISIMKDMLKVSGAKTDETEGFIDFITGIEGVEVGICVLEMENNKYKISFRSRKADVNAVAKTFGGGGHVLASGCQISGSYEEVIDKLVFATSRYIDE